MPTNGTFAHSFRTKVPFVAKGSAPHLAHHGDMRCTGCTVPLVTVR